MKPDDKKALDTMKKAVALSGSGIYTLPLDRIDMNADALILLKAKLAPGLRVKDFKSHSRLHTGAGKPVKIVVVDRLPSGAWEAIAHDGSVLESGNIVQDIRNDALTPRA